MTEDKAYELSNYVVSSLIVEAVPEQVDSLVQDLQAIDGLEIHEQQGNNILVTYEDDSVSKSEEAMQSISNDTRVIAVNLIYCNFEDA